MAYDYSCCTYTNTFNANKLIWLSLSLIKKMGGVLKREIITTPFSVLDSNPVNSA